MFESADPATQDKINDLEAKMFKSLETSDEFAVRADEAFADNRTKDAEMELTSQLICLNAATAFGTAVLVLRGK